MNLVSARAPARLDFGGGWTDVPPYSDEQGGIVCNVAISRYARATLRLHRESDGPADDETALARAALTRAALIGVSLHMTSDYPRGAGLGGSSAAGVAAMGAIQAWRGHPVEDRASIAEQSRQVEVEDMGIAGGRQDHYAAAFGGALKLEFAHRTTVTPIALAPATRAALATQCLVFFTGQSRISGETISAVLNAYRARDAQVCAALFTIKQLAAQMVVALSAGDLRGLGALVGEHWRAQKSLHPAITTPRIDAMMEAALAAGAWGGKALGASGGGCVLFIVPADRVTAVRTAATALGTHIPFTIDEHGLMLEHTE